MNFKVFNSQSTFPPPCDQSPQAGSQAATREPDPSDGPHDLDERFLDVIVDFKLRNATGEFPTVSILCSMCVYKLVHSHNVLLCSTYQLPTQEISLSRLGILTCWMCTWSITAVRPLLDCVLSPSLYTCLLW